MFWTYHALTRTGEDVSGIFEGDRANVCEFIAEHQWELVGLKANYFYQIKQHLKQGRISSEVLAQFFTDFNNMFATGMTVNEIINTIGETTTHSALKSILLKTNEKLAEGESLSKAFASFQAIPWIVHSTIFAGECSGKLNDTIAVLGTYFEQQGKLKTRIASAAVYPIMVFILLIIVMLFVSLHVVPKLHVLLPPEAMSNPATVFVVSVSALLQKCWFFGLITILLVAISIYHYCKAHRPEFELFLYRLPFIGEILKESTLSFYFLNLSVLLKSGVPLLKALGDLEGSMGNVTSYKFAACRDHILGGASFWESMSGDNFFPSVIVHTLRRGEEVAQIPSYCENLTVYFQQRSQSKMDQMVHLIQPLLLGFGGLFLVVIAFAFLIPIYGSLTKIAGG